MAKQNLTTVHEEFSKKMIERIRAKQRHRFVGWDSEEWDAWGIPRRMLNKSLEVLLKGESCDPKDLIDIANFAMFLHKKVA